MKTKHESHHSSASPCCCRHVAAEADDGDDPAATDGAQGERSPVGGQTAGRGGRPGGQGVNRPKDGTYTYEFTSESTNAARATATPSHAPPDAEFTSKVSYDGERRHRRTGRRWDQSVTTVKHRGTTTRVVELSFSAKTTAAPKARCNFDEPIDRPAASRSRKGKLPTAVVRRGEGVNCNRTSGRHRRRRSDDSTTPNGVAWPTWRIKIETITASRRAHRRPSTSTRWFSPDLGKDVRVRGDHEYINPKAARCAAHAETEEPA